MPALLAAAVRKLNREIKPDLVLCGGDMINLAAAEDAWLLTGNIAGILSLLDAPCVTIRGNHDLPEDKFTEIFKFQHITDIGHVRIVSFDDPELPGYNAWRPEENIKRMKQAAADWKGLLFSFQHVPLLPSGRCIHNYKNADEVLQLMREFGYRGTVSGHYHPGIPLFQENGLQFVVQSAMAEAPHCGSLLEIDGNGIADIKTFQVGTGLDL